MPTAPVASRRCASEGDGGMTRLLIVLSVSHLIAFLLPLGILIAALDWLIARPTITIAGFAFTCGTVMSEYGPATACVWVTPW